MQPQMRREGDATMNLIEDAIDPGAPEYVVTGIASVERISVGQVRIAKYSRRPDGTNQILFYEVWDYETWKATFPAYEVARHTIESEPIPDDPERRAGMH